jgi:hypothetical protein
MYVNAYMHLGRRGQRRAVEVNSNMIYLIHCKNFYKCHNVSPPSTTIKGKKYGSMNYVILQKTTSSGAINISYP